MSRRFYKALALVFFAFAVYETAINFLLSDTNETLRKSVAVLGTCIPAQRRPNHIEAAYEL